MLIRTAAILLLASTAWVARADILILRDGTRREGTIESRSPRELVLRLAGQGISATITIPTDDVIRIEPSPGDSTPSQPAPPVGATHTPPAATAPQEQLKPLFVNRPLDARGFLVELASSALGNGVADPDRLPAAQRATWDAAIAADIKGQRAETLQALRELEESLRNVPGGMERLNAVTRGMRNQPFGQWLGTVHWDVIGEKYRTGNFDLRDVREAERPVLIGILREKTGPALEPLRTYFPPLDEKTGNPVPFKPAQLQAITAGNALEIKDKALFATAVLLAQIKLEPEMPLVDRQLLSSQLVMVNRVLSKARDLEPAARMAMARAEIERKASEERARRDAALQRQRAALAPK